MYIEKSKLLFESAKKVIPGGVNSPARAFKSVGGDPLFINKAKGSYIYDVDGNKLIDYVCSWGPMILGHANDEVINAVTEAIKRGTSYGAPTEIETKLAELICSALPSVNSVRMVNSGTEAVMSALRLARGFTNRKKIVKFAGCYHGHVDSLLIKAGSGLITYGKPDSAGVVQEVAANTFCAKYNDLKSVNEIFSIYGSEIAAIIVEPVAGNMGVVPPKEGFLEGLREICDKNGALLIFDEVITGFRVGFGGAQSLYYVMPDITILGKIIGGGFPVGAYGGRKDIMKHLSPDGTVYQAGTLSGNPIAMTAGYETLKILRDNHIIYKQLEKNGAKIEEAIEDLKFTNKLPIKINRVGSMFTIFFNQDDVVDYDSALKSNTEMFNKYFHLMLENGIYLPPSQFEANFISYAHSDEDIDKTIDSYKKSFSEISE